MKNMVGMVFLVVALALVLAARQPVAAQACDPAELLPCLAAVTSLSPSEACCAALTAQQSCLCGYEKNPSFTKQISIEDAKRLITACKIPVPNC